MDDGTLIGLAGLAVGAIGAATGITAIAYAHVAMGAAHKANEIAGDSKNLAAEANELARDSNTIATDAKQLAEEANEYSDRAEGRETERHDVRWEGGWVAKGVYRIYKLGDDAAHDVKATVRVDREEQTATAALLQEERGFLDFRFPGAAGAHDRERLEDADFRRRASVGPLGVGFSSPPLRAHTIVERISWTTDRGTPKTHTEKKYPPNLGRF